MNQAAGAGDASAGPRPTTASGPGQPRASHAALVMFASAIRGGPVELVDASPAAAPGPGPREHWTTLALRLAARETAEPVEFRLESADQEDNADDDHRRADDGLAVARILRSLAWRRAGSASPEVGAFLARAPDPSRLHGLLAACEAIRVRPAIARLYPGARTDLARLEAAERAMHEASDRSTSIVSTSLGAPAAAAAPVARAGGAIDAALARIRLDMPPSTADAQLPAGLRAALSALARPGATSRDSARCALACWRLERGESLAVDGADPFDPLDPFPIPESPTSALPPGPPGGEAGAETRRDEEANADQPGATELGAPGTGGEQTGAEGLRPGAAAAVAPAAEGIRVDEWDYLGRRFLRRWCRIVVARPAPRAGDYRAELLQRERAQARRLRRQFARLRAAATRRRRVPGDGEEIDADDMVRTLVERRAGIVGDEPRMIRRERARRDVAVALLLDTSASTDFVLRDPDELVDRPPPVPVEDDDPFLWSPTIFDPPPGPEGPPPRRVIDVARDAMGLLAQAFESLGDRFALYAFSGSGREQVDFLIAKDFDEAMAPQGWQALAGLEPMRSTRMGAAIRHATDRLGRRPERMRVLLVVSDGYPDDIDYGPDRRSVEYGLRDTARAIEQARGRGIDTLLVTVDRAGHDYLRRICPAGRYRVIDEIDSLAGEIARAYRTMTG